MRSGSPLGPHAPPTSRPSEAVIEAFFQFLVLGVGSGAIYGALGLSVVLTYRGSGVINFAYGAIAMYPAYVFSALKGSGELWVPVWSSSFQLSDVPLGSAASLTIALLEAAALGLAMHLLIFRPMRYAPAVAKVVASIGIFVVLQAVVVLQFGTGQIAVSAVLPSEPVVFWGVTVGRDRLLVACAVVVVAVVLSMVFRYTRFGLITRAAAENEKGSVLLGYSPDALAAVNWVVASVLAGLFGILVGPIVALNPQTYTVLIVPALAAALIGRFSSFGITAGAAIVLGMMQTEILHLQSLWTWVPQIGVQQALPFVIIIVAMVVLGGRLPGRGSIVEGRLPAALRPRRPLVLGGVAFAVGLVLCLVLNDAYRGALVTSLIGAMVCVSLVVLTGYVGQLSLAQMTFAGVGGFAVSRFAYNMHIPFPVSPVLAVLVAVAAGALAGLPAIRIRGVSLAVVTIGLAVAVSEFVFKNPAYTGGFNGATIPEVSIFGHQLGIAGDPGFAVFTLVVLTAVCAMVCKLRNSGTGLRMLAVRANERAAAAAGINVAATKLVAFAISAGIAGLAGVMLGYSQSTLTFSSFDVLVSLAIFATAYLGGIATVSGAVVGGLITANGLIFYFLDRQFEFGKYVLLISGLGLIVTAVLNPEGIAGGVRLSAAALRDRVRRRNGPRGEHDDRSDETVEVLDGSATSAR